MSNLDRDYEAEFDSIVTSVVSEDKKFAKLSERAGKKLSNRSRFVRIMVLPLLVLFGLSMLSFAFLPAGFVQVIALTAITCAGFGLVYSFLSGYFSTQRTG